jgi:hypothetical protein
MKTHVTIIGIIRIGLSAVTLLSGCLMFSLMWGIGLSVASDDPTALTVLGLIGSLVGGLLIILSVPGIIAGIGLLKYKNWARYLVLLLAVFDLFMFPLGTAFAIYTFWALVQEETVTLFTGEEWEDLEVEEEVIEAESVEET